MRYHFTLVRIAIIKKSTNNKCWRGCGEKGMLLYCWWECKLIEPLWKTLWRSLKKTRKLEIKSPYDPGTSLLVIYPDETKTEKDTYIPLFIAALPTIARTWKQDRWMDKEVVHMHSGILLSHKKECLWVSSGEMDEPRICYIEWSES